MSLHVAQIFIGLYIIILPIINIYFLAKLSNLLDTKKEKNKEGS